MLFALLCCVPLWAIDVIKLKNGNLLEGEIYQKENDGALYIRLTDGNLRYLIPDEISSIESDSRKFEIIENGNSNQKKNYSFFIYTGYELTIPSKFTFEDKQINFQDYSPGLSLGFGFSLPIKYGISFDPSIELALEFFKVSKHFNSNVCNLNHINSEYSEEGSHKPLSWLSRIPIIVSYRVLSNPKFKLSIFTGPVFESIIVYDFNNWSGRLYGSYKCTHYYENLYDYDHSKETYVGWDDNRFAFYWRFGLKFHFKNVFCSASYSIGLNNRISDAFCREGYHMSSEINAKIRRDLLKISIGLQF